MSLVSCVPRNVAIWGRVVFATQETSPYDIAVVSLEEDLDGVPTPVPTEHFHEGKGRESNVVGAPAGLQGVSVDTNHARPDSQIAPFPIPAKQRSWELQWSFGGLTVDFRCIKRPQVLN